MSTHYVPIEILQRVAATKGLAIKAVQRTSPREYRVTINNETRILFHGTADRVSDFITGWNAKP